MDGMLMGENACGFQALRDRIKPYDLYSVIEEQPDHPVSLFARQWAALASNGTPLRRDFNPMQVHRMIEYVMILECEKLPTTGVDYRFRLIGDKIGYLYKIASKGDTISALLAPSTNERVQACLAQVIDTGTPDIGLETVPLSGGEQATIVSGRFPFVSQEGKDQIFVVQAPTAESLEQYCTHYPQHVW